MTIDYNVVWAWTHGCSWKDNDLALNGDNWPKNRIRLLKEVLELVDESANVLGKDPVARYCENSVEVVQEATIGVNSRSCVVYLSGTVNIEPQVLNPLIPLITRFDGIGFKGVTFSVDLSVSDFHEVDFVAFVGNKRLLLDTLPVLDIFVLGFVNVMPVAA